MLREHGGTYRYDLCKHVCMHFYNAATKRNIVRGECLPSAHTAALCAAPPSTMTRASEHLSGLSTSVEPRTCRAFDPRATNLCSSLCLCVLCPVSYKSHPPMPATSLCRHCPVITRVTLSPSRSQSARSLPCARKYEHEPTPSTLRPQSAHCSCLHSSLPGLSCGTCPSRQSVIVFASCLLDTVLHRPHVYPWVKKKSAFTFLDHLTIDQFVPVSVLVSVSFQLGLAGQGRVPEETLKPCARPAQVFHVCSFRASIL